MFKLVKQILEIYNTVLNFQTRISAYVVFPNNFFLFMSWLLICVRGDQNVAPWRHWLVQFVCKNNIQVIFRYFDNIQVVYIHTRENSEKDF